jgi:hypothetical protein
MTTTLNGNVRKSLAEQIDRLDGILDGLADSLSGAIADAIRDTVGPAVKEAVQAVLIDVLGNPKVLEKLRAPAPAPVPETPKRSFIARLTNRVKAWARTAWTKIRQACSVCRQRLSQAPIAAVQHGQILWAYRKPLLVAVGAGVASGLAAFYAGPWMAATAGTAAGFTAAAATQLTLTLRRLVATYTMPDDARP